MNKKSSPSGAAITAVIFDLDGTLLDSLDVWHQIDVDFLGRRGLALPEDYARAIVTMHLEEAADYTIARFSLNERREDVVKEWLDSALYAYGHTVPLKPGAAAYVRRLKERGLHLAVATALAEELAVPALRRHGLYDLFETVVFAAEVGQGKSSPAIYLATARRLGVPPEECLVFEDTLAGVTTAKAAGMRAYGVEDPHAIDERVAIMTKADGYVVSFENGPRF